MVETNIILGLISHDKDFRKGFMQKARDIYADIISFIANPNCTCRKRVVSFIEENKESINTFYEDFIKDKSDEEINNIIKSIDKPKEVKKESPSIDKPNPKKEKNDVRGEVIEIEPNPFEYKEVIQTAIKEDWVYKGINIVETIKVENEVEKPVWLIFFY